MFDKKTTTHLLHVKRRRFTNHSSKQLGDPSSKLPMATTTNDRGTMDGTVLKISVGTVALVTVSLQSACLAICFLTAIFFRFEEVTKTTCEVEEYIPSISAVTGITPQAYLWRTITAVNSAPWMIMTLVYYNHYVSRMHLIPSHRLSLFKVLVRLNFWLCIVANVALLLVTYITNRENYQLHENVFLVFITANLSYLVLNTTIFKWTLGKDVPDLERRSHMFKKAACASALLATAVALFFYSQHHYFCIKGAFSLFSVFEYLIAYSNMWYNSTCYFAFKEKYFMIGASHTSVSSPDRSTRATEAESNHIKAKHQ